MAAGRVGDEGGGTHGASGEFWEPVVGLARQSGDFRCHVANDCSVLAASWTLASVRWVASGADNPMTKGEHSSSFVLLGEPMFIFVNRWSCSPNMDTTAQ